MTTTKELLKQYLETAEAFQLISVRVADQLYQLAELPTGACATEYCTVRPLQSDLSTQAQQLVLASSDIYAALKNLRGRLLGELQGLLLQAAPAVNIFRKIDVLQPLTPEELRLVITVARDAKPSFLRQLLPKYTEVSGGVPIHMEDFEALLMMSMKSADDKLLGVCLACFQEATRPEGQLSFRETLQFVKQSLLRLTTDIRPCRVAQFLQWVEGLHTADGMSIAAEVFQDQRFVQLLAEREKNGPFYQCLGKPFFAPGILKQLAAVFQDELEHFSNNAHSQHRLQPVTDVFETLLFADAEHIALEHVCDRLRCMIQKLQDNFSYCQAAFEAFSATQIFDPQEIIRQLQTPTFQYAIAARYLRSTEDFQKLLQTPQNSPVLGAAAKRL